MIDLPCVRLSACSMTAGVGRVDHDRHFDLLHQRFEEGGDVGHLVAVGILQADVEHVGAFAHLGTSDLGRLIDLAGGDQLLELAAAEDVGALADDHRARVVIDGQCLDA